MNTFADENANSSKSEGEYEKPNGNPTKETPCEKPTKEKPDVKIELTETSHLQSPSSTKFRHRSFCMVNFVIFTLYYAVFAIRYASPGADPTVVPDLRYVVLVEMALQFIIFFIYTCFDNENLRIVSIATRIYGMLKLFVYSMVLCYVGAHLYMGEFSFSGEIIIFLLIGSVEMGVIYAMISNIPAN